MTNRLVCSSISNGLPVASFWIRISPPKATAPYARSGLRRRRTGDLRAQVEPDEVLPEVDAHGYLQEVYPGLIQPNGSRLKAAIAALPFERPKLAVVATTSSEDLVERLERAMEARMKVINSRPVQVLEAPKADAGLPEPEPLPDHSAPFAQNTKHRLKRI